MDDQYGFAVRQDDLKLKEAMDRVLARIREDGTYGEMHDRWFPEQGDPGPMPDIPSSGENGVLNFGTAAVAEPMSYVFADQGAIGFDIEYAAYIAQDLGMELKEADISMLGRAKQVKVDTYFKIVGAIAILLPTVLVSLFEILFR